MQQVDAAVTIKADEHVDGLEVLYQHRVFPATFPREERSASAAARLNLKRRAMNMHRVRAVALGNKAPALDLSERHLKVNSVHVIDFPIDFAHAIEAERARRHGQPHERFACRQYIGYSSVAACCAQNDQLLQKSLQIEGLQNHLR